MAQSKCQNMDLLIVPSTGKTAVWLSNHLTPVTDNSPIPRQLTQSASQGHPGHPGNLRHVESDDDLALCHSVMRQLRPHLDDARTFVERARRQQAQGWRLLAQWQDAAPNAPTAPIALAGYRWLDNLVHGRFIYVDDLVTTESTRGQQSGRLLLSELEQLAKAGGAHKLVLDAAMANSRAHRFYFRCGLLATGLHFTKVLA